METDFDKIIKTHYGILFKVARSYTSNKDDFDDLYQEILIQIWTSLSKFKNQSKISTWLYRVALNTALTFVKKDKKEKSKFSDVPLENQKAYYDSERTTVSQDKISSLYKCINLLNKSDRAIILLYLEKCSYEEIAEIVGISVNNVGVKISRIKTKLHELLKANHYE